MTGTGTQTDPFCPTNWDEFVTAIGQSGVYIECPENGVWDMNEILPDGIENNITWCDNTVYGNGLTIKNLYFNGGYFDLTESAETNVYKLNFLNISTSGSSDKIFYNAKSSKTVFFRNCKFSGLISSGIVFRTSTSNSSKMYLTHDDDKGCSLNFEFTGNGVLFNTGVYFTYCNIKLGGQSATTVYNSSDSSYAAFEKCYVSGEMPFQRWNFRGYDNIFDIEIHSDTQIINNQGSLNQWITNVLNSDKMHGEYNRPDYNSIFLQATTEQLSDAAYLQSIGFSIAAG